MYHCRIKPTVKTKLKIATLQHKLALYFSSRYNCYLNILVCRNFQVKESCCCRYMSYGLHDTPSSCCCAKEEMIYVYHVSNCFQMHVPAAIQLPLTASCHAHAGFWSERAESSTKCACMQAPTTQLVLWF